MRKLLSILLLTLFSFTLVSPLFALGGDVEDGLPACCRRGGAHQCAMGMGGHGDAVQAGVRLSAPLQKCPYCPRAVSSVHQDVMSVDVSDGLFASLMTHPAGVAQTESKWRISRDRSRQKRGPPSLLG
ncbi:hypothetical protein [Granulicella sibirica]|uniref:hypothetical protein n=1 Tax=Granulicella sibirica TaxID=2479048 RepID=UPI001008DBE7|nr:hypothetical protein [Granulicella sibirica]